MRVSSIVKTTILLAIAAACAAAGPTTTTTPPAGGGDDTLALSKVSGDAQQATMGAALAAPLVVLVANAHGAPMSGVTVSWSAAPGNGALSTGTSVSDASGHASVRWTLDATYLGTSVTAAIPKASVTFSALGNGSGDLGGRPFFPADNPWRADVSSAPLDANSANLIASCGPSVGMHPDFGTVYAGAPNGIPYVVVHGNQSRVPVSFTYADESDPGPYPIPPYAPIEGGPSSTGDRHVIVLDADNWKLYELYAAYPASGGARWASGSGAIFDLTSNALRPAGWTSADAAGLPILPGLVRYDEVAIHHAIEHAIRFTCVHTRKAYVPPARHWASTLTGANYAPMGMRVRLKAGVDISSYSATNQVILRALKKYGMILADNGADMMIGGAPDPRWSDDDLHNLTHIHGSDFEVVQMNGMVVGN